MDIKSKADIERVWSNSDGFTYQKSLIESFQFKQLCKQINAVHDSSVSEAAWNYITNEIIVNDDPGVIGY